MRYRFLLSLLILACCMSLRAQAQEVMNDTIYNPTILYNGTPKQYEIADIKVSGVKNY